jgi:hypothetical protein
MTLATGLSVSVFYKMVLWFISLPGVNNDKPHILHFGLAQFVWFCSEFGTILGYLLLEREMAFLQS